MNSRSLVSGRCVARRCPPLVGASRCDARVAATRRPYRSSSLPAAFSLVELLVVIAIIAIMASIVISAFSNAAADSRLVLVRQQQAVVQEAVNSWLAYRSANPALAERQILDLMVQRAYSVMSNDVLIAIPLFVFMGYLVERAALIDRLFKSLHLATARVPGALAVATIVTCAIFATATGIVGAVVTLMGLLAFPAMLKAGYNTKVAAGAVTGKQAENSDVLPWASVAVQLTMPAVMPDGKLREKLNCASPLLLVTTLGTLSYTSGRLAA